MKKQGKFFVLDGPDGSGKTTQLQLLTRRLAQEKKKTAVVDFPQYKTSFFGNMVGEYLKGRYGDALHVSPYLSSLLFALDRSSAKRRMEKDLNNGVIILANRYTSSNIIHQGARFKDSKERNRFFEWLNRVEFIEFGIPKPTKVIFLDVPPDLSWALIEQRNRKGYAMGSKRDQYENNRAHLRKAYEIAKAYAKHASHWSIIACAPKGVLLTPQQIHERVYAIVKRNINL